MNKINIGQFDIKCSDIAKHLGGLYIPQPDCCVPRGEIILANSAVSLVGCEHTGRVEVSGVWPTNSKNELCRPRSYDKSHYTPITVSLSRDAKAIARDISTRFLPAYLTELGVQKIRCAGDNERAARTEALTARLSQVSQGKRYQNSPNEISLNGVRSDIYGRAKVFGESVNIELSSLSPAQAEAVLKLFVTL